MRLAILLLACPCLLPSIVDVASAQSPVPRPVSEREFLERVQRTDPRLDALAARVDLDRAEVVDAGRLANPALAFDREEVFDGGSLGAENFLRLQWPVDVSGRRGRRQQAARRGVDAARAESQRAAFLLLLDALDLYHDAAHARLRTETLRQGREALAGVVEVVRARKSAGDVSGYDLHRLELELADYDDQIAEAEIGLAGWRRRLAALAGAPGELHDAVDPLELPAPVARQPGDGLRARQDLRAALLRIDQADRELAAARRGWVPGLIVSGGLATADLGDRHAIGYVAGLAIDLPLFDRDQAARARSEARRREHQATARAIEREATAAIEVAADELARRIEQGRRHRTDQVDRLADLLRRAQTVYREGDRPIVELLDAHRTAREIRLRALDIRRDALRARTALWRARGYR